MPQARPSKSKRSATSRTSSVEAIRNPGSESPKYWGIVEGFYGRPWSMEDRDQLCDWLGREGLNTYLYAPKDDPRHRSRWFDAYPSAEAKHMQRLISRCQQHGVEFIYALAPGYQADFTAAFMERFLARKVQHLQSLGCRHFALLFDDLPPGVSAANLSHYGSWAGAHVAWTHQILAQIRSHDPRARLLFCPTPYCDTIAGPLDQNDYLREVGERLAPEIDVLWTGSEIVPEEITLADVERVKKVIRRAPVIWDNLYANDYDLRRMNLGPYEGRPVELKQAVQGIVINPNTEVLANFVPLRTFAAYVSADRTWNVDAAYKAALVEWLPNFTSRGATRPSLEELQILTDCLYLPHRLGQHAQRLIADVDALLKSGPPSQKAAWTRFQRMVATVMRWQAILTEMENRELCHTLYRHAWEIREELDLLNRFFQHSLARAKKERSADARFTSIFHRLGTYRGGLTARLQKMLRMNPDGTFTTGTPAKPGP